MMGNKTCIYLCFTLLSLTACTSSKKYDYFQKGVNAQQKITEFSTQNKPVPVHKVDVGDVLEINYYTPDEINQSIVSSNDEGEKKNKINLFAVNGDGNIDLPLVGPCNVKGLTIPEVKDSVGLKLKNFFNITYMYVRLNSFPINVIGEVNKPGLINVQNDRINIIQALSMAGDLTQYGNKKQVMILRKENEKMKIYEFDLTDLNIVNSDAYYLKSNDIIYAKPLRAKNASAILPFASLGLTLLNTVLIIFQISKK
jgi:polysaccharide export outer membrane protein